MKKIQNIIMASAFVLALIGAFAFNTKDNKPLTTVTRWEQITSNSCVSTSCSDIAPDPVQFCYSTSLSNLYQTQLSSMTCQTAETVYKYLPQ